MINPKELRIGNIIQYVNDGTDATVQTVSKVGLDVEFAEEETWIEVDQFEGFPLTEYSIQEIFHLVLDVGKYGKYYKCPIFHNFRLWQDKESKTWCIGRDEKKGCTFIAGGLRYIHEIQNAYFALTKQEIQTAI